MTAQGSRRLRSKWNNTKHIFYLIRQSAIWVVCRMCILFKYPTHQIVFCTEKALKTLRFEGSEKL